MLVPPFYEFSVLLLLGYILQQSGKSVQQRVQKVQTQQQVHDEYKVHTCHES